MIDEIFIDPQVRSEMLLCKSDKKVYPIRYFSHRLYNILLTILIKDLANIVFAYHEDCINVTMKCESKTVGFFSFYEKVLCVEFENSRFDVIYTDNVLTRIINVFNPSFSVFNSSLANDYRNVLPAFNYLMKHKYGVNDYISYQKNGYICTHKKDIITILRDYSHVLKMQIIDECQLLRIILILKHVIW